MTAGPRLPLPEEPAEPAPQRRRGRPRRDARGPGEPDTRASLLSSAALLFASRGYDNASLADIASGAGATTGAIYAHFRGKPELLVEVIRETLAFLSFRSAGPGAMSEPEALVGYARWLLRPERRTTRMLINEVYNAAGRVPEVFDMVRRYAESEAAAVAERLSEWQQAGKCDPIVDAELAAHQLFIDVLGLCRIDSFAPELLDDDRWHRLVQARVRDLIGAPEPHGHKPRSARGRATRSR